MKHLLTILLSFSMIATSCPSWALDGAISLTKGQPAPYAGVLMGTELAGKVYSDLKYKDQLILVNQSLMKSIDLYKTNETQYKNNISGLEDVNQKLLVAVQDANSNNFWRNALYFGLGVITASAVVYATRPR